MRKYLLSLSLALFFLLPLSAQAAFSFDIGNSRFIHQACWFQNGPGCPATTGDTFAAFLSTLWGKVFAVIFTLLGSAAVLLLIWNGIQYITAGGSQEKLQKAKRSIIQIILGIVVLFAAFLIVDLILGAASSLLP